MQYPVEVTKLSGCKFTEELLSYYSFQNFCFTLINILYFLITCKHWSILNFSLL